MHNCIRWKIKKIYLAVCVSVVSFFLNAADVSSEDLRTIHIEQNTGGNCNITIGVNSGALPPRIVCEDGAPVSELLRFASELSWRQHRAWDGETILYLPDTWLFRSDEFGMQARPRPGTLHDDYGVRLLSTDRWIFDEAKVIDAAAKFMRYGYLSTHSGAMPDDWRQELLVHRDSALSEILLSDSVALDLSGVFHDIHNTDESEDERSRRLSFWVQDVEAHATTITLMERVDFEIGESLEKTFPAQFLVGPGGGDRTYFALLYSLDFSRLHRNKWDTQFGHSGFSETAILRGPLGGEASLPLTILVCSGNSDYVEEVYTICRRIFSQVSVNEVDCGDNANQEYANCMEEAVQE